MNLPNRGWIGTTEIWSESLKNWHFVISKPTIVEFDTSDCIKIIIHNALVRKHPRGICIYVGECREFMYNLRHHMMSTRLLTLLILLSVQNHQCTLQNNCVVQSYPSLSSSHIFSCTDANCNLFGAVSHVEKRACLAIPRSIRNAQKHRWVQATTLLISYQDDLVSSEFQ